jgi:hypothetical protein
MYMTEPTAHKKNCAVFPSHIPAKMRLLDILRHIIAPITRYFSPGSSDNTGEVLPLHGRQERIPVPWSAIFSKKDWLHKVMELGGEPALIGPQLSSVSSPGETGKFHMLLLTNFMRDEAPSDSLRQLFFASLKQGYAHHQRGQYVDEIKIGNHITVDVTQALRGPAWLEIKARRIKQLFVLEHKRLHSQYCFFSEGRIGTLQPQNFTRQDWHTIATQRDLSQSVILHIPHEKRAFQVLIMANRGEL